MAKFDFTNLDTTDYSSSSAYVVPTTNYDRPGSREINEYQNERWQTDWNYFNDNPKLRSAILMKAIWQVGKGYTTTPSNEVILDHISGDGKQTFFDILLNMVINAQIFRDSFAEIIRERDVIINMKLLPPDIKIIYDKQGRILRYEQHLNGKVTTWQPDEIFHLSNQKFGNEIHGRSIPETLEKYLKSDSANFEIMNRVTQFQAVPFIIFKVKSDDATTIQKFKTNIRTAREKKEDLIIPDDENILSWEIVSLSPSQLLMEWRTNLNNEFYRAVGLPLILFGSAGSTESGGKIEYLAHETVFKKEQLQLEKQIEAQLGIALTLNSPASLLENLQTDERKDAQNAINFQQSDVQAGVGR